MATALIRPEIDVDKVCRIILKARQFHAKEGLVEEDYGANAADEGFRTVLAGYHNDPVFDELKTFMDDLDMDEQCELVALAWIGRGDFTADDWAEALHLAKQEHNDRTAEYLLGTPLLADYLGEGLARFALSCEEMEKDRL